MTIDTDKKERQLTNRLSEFSARFMSNSKWTKVFHILSKNNDLIVKCNMKDVYDDLLRQVHIPSIENFHSEFYDKGFKDGRNQSYTFKEIQWLEFPSTWTIKREMRGQSLESHKFEQDILRIKALLQDIGQFEVELHADKLVLYGYK